MPLRIVIKATVPSSPRGHVPYRDLHRLACFLMEDPGSEAHQNQQKTFSIQPPVFMDQGRTVELHLNSLIDDLNIVHRLQERLLGIKGQTANLGQAYPLQNSAIDCSGESWDEFAELAPSRNVTIETLSPISFSRNGDSFNLPDAKIVHSQLIRKWRAVAPERSASINQEAEDDLMQNVVLVSFDINSRHIDETWKRRCFEGTFSYNVRSSSLATQSLFTQLWAFATYSGVGAMTTHGLGAIEIKF